MHLKSIKLKDDLFLFGFGGSVPALQNGETKWQGFPFKSDTEFSEGFTPFFRKSMESVTQNDTVLLMTHIGPDVVSTNIDTYYEINNAIYAGSPSLSQLLKEQIAQSRILLNVHGHTHFCAGMAKYGIISVINPGSLRMREFAVLKLSKENNWKIKSIEFNSLE